MSTQLTIVLLGYLVLSVVTFVVYAIDKSAARRRAWRTPESTLHLLALCGGWPGALLARQRLRHKSSKRSFGRVLWLTVVVNLLGLVMVWTPLGRELWRRIAG